MTELEDRLDRWERLWAGLTGEPREGEGEVDPDGIERSVRDRGERGRELRMRIVEGLGGSVGVKRERQTSGNGNGNGMVLPPQSGPGMNNPNSTGTGDGNGMNMHNQQYSNNLMLDPPVPIPNFLHPNNISLPTPLSSTTTLPLNVSLPVTAPSTAPPSPRTAEWAQSPQIDKNLDGTGSFTRSGGSGSSYLGLSSGVTFLNAILKLCKERGGIFIDVENTLPGDAQASGPPGKVGMGGAKGSEGADLGLGLGLGLALDVKQLDAADRKPGSPRATSPVEGDPGLSNAEIVVRARTLPPKEEYMPFVDSYFMYFREFSSLSRIRCPCRLCELMNCGLGFRWDHADGARAYGQGDSDGEDPVPRQRQLPRLDLHGKLLCGMLVRRPLTQCPRRYSLWVRSIASRKNPTFTGRNTVISPGRFSITTLWRAGASSLFRRLRSWRITCRGTISRTRGTCACKSTSPA